MNYSFNAPLFDAVVSATKNDVVRFHMPGHSGVGSGTSFFASAKYDFTEISGLDNLLSPTGVIADAERLAAEAYGCDDALIYSQGATTCMHTAVLCVRDKGRAVCVGDMHKSFWHAAMLYNLEVLNCDISNLNNALAAGGVGSVFITSPNYLGKTQNLKYIRQLCNKYGVATVIDAAHGAHFPFSKLLPENPNKYCDIAIFSQHKTMCAYGGGAMLCVSGAFSDFARVNRQLIHSTSPSYLVMSSVDYSRAMWSERGEKIYSFISECVEKFKSVIPKGYSVYDNDDISRLVVSCGGDAVCVAKGLEEKGVYCEAAIGDKLVFILTPYNCSYLTYLAGALKGITPKKPKQTPIFNLNKVCCSGKVTTVKIDECEGKIACMPIGLYPPGTPLIFAGEVIDGDAAMFIKENRDKLFGLASGKVVVLE
ncbi:MAG: aminotransferase class I/II-fold pyridoxal phosphate-dependent enzyme [Clostridia bacterium]|nr:aminotransferase class I/II-fold pyridoxal phosphate-dependent enzyme [Clostridia bacterium]